MAITKKKKLCRVCGRGDSKLIGGFCAPTCEAPTVTVPKVAKLPNGTDAPDTDQAALFLRILSERGPYSEVSGNKLITDQKHKLFWWQFSHLLGKGRYPDYKLDERNVVLKTASEHIDWQERKQSLGGLPLWVPILAREALLMAEAEGR